MENYKASGLKLMKFNSIKRRIKNLLSTGATYSEMISLQQILNEIEDYEKSIIEDKYEWIVSDYEKLKNF